MMHFDTIAFDADDTLWHSETFYLDAQNALLALLSVYGIDQQAALDVLHRIDIANLPTFGFGIKSYTLSMIEAAIEATGGRISARDIGAIVDLGRGMTQHELQLLEHSADVVARLAQTHTLMLITKGDLMDQERKLVASGLVEYFKSVEIVSEKNAATYMSLLRKHSLAPERFLMVGNSLRSDILPVLEVGAWAVFVPYSLTWAHELASPPPANQRFFEITHLGELPELVARMENGN